MKISLLTSLPLTQYLSQGRLMLKSPVCLIGALAIGCLSLLAFKNRDSFHSPFSHNTRLLCVLYDAGETTALLPVLKKLETEGKDFRVLVMGTAETLIKPDMFEGKRLTLKDLHIDTVIDTTTPRITGLAEDRLAELTKINPKVVLVGTASRIQQQVLEQFPASTTVAFIDNFDYDKQNPLFSTVEKVQAAAQHVLCPSKHTRTLFDDESKNGLLPTYHVVGKPSLQEWRKEIETANRAEILQKLNFREDRPIVTFIGGYGPAYEVINPLFSQCAERLEKEGYQVIQQPHPKVAPPKVKITEALAVSQCVIGYNSSVILDSAIGGVRSVFFIPEDPRTQFKHFAIEKGLVPKVSSHEELLEFIKKGSESGDIRQKLDIPEDSMTNITQLLNQWMD